jgi:hypothetical protein
MSDNTDETDGDVEQEDPRALAALIARDADAAHVHADDPDANDPRRLADLIRRNRPRW